MKLIKNDKYQGFYDENDYEEFYYIKPFRVKIVSEQNEVIGEATGQVIDMMKVMQDVKEYNGRNFFLSLDEISELCCNVAEFILEKKNFFSKSFNLCFLNRISILEEYTSKEVETNALRLLFDYYDTVIYSLGSIELDDDFPDMSEVYWKDHEQMVKSLGWKFDKTYEFFYKQELDLWTNEKINSRVHKPVSVIEVTQEEQEFWLWLFDHAKSLCADEFYAGEFYDDKHALELLNYYEHSTVHLELIMKWSANNNIGQAPLVNISPFFINFFLNYCTEMIELRTDGCIKFTDPEVESSMDSILQKYNEMVLNNIELIGFYDFHVPIVNQYILKRDEFWIKRVSKLIKNEVEEYRRKMKSIFE